MLILFITLARATPPSLPPAVSPAPVETAAGALPIALAALGAAVLTHLLGRRRLPAPPAVRRLGQGAGLRPFGPGLPGTGDGTSVWITPPDDLGLFAASLAARLAARGPVLLMCRPQDRGDASARFGPGSAPVWICEEERPSAARALAAAATLGSDGRSPALVVAGATALERVVGGRPAAALEELIRATGLPVFVVCAEGEPVPAGPWPAVRITRDPEGWSAGDRRFVLADGWIQGTEG